MPAANPRIMLPVVAILCALEMLFSSASAEDTYEPQPLRVPASLRSVGDAPAPSPSTPTLPRAQALTDTTPVSNTSASGPSSFAGGSSPGNAQAEQPTSFQSPGVDQAQGDWRKEPNELVEQNPGSKKLPVRKSSDTLALRPVGEDAENPARSPSSGLGTMFASLCLVLGLFFMAVWMIKKAAPKGARLLPTEAVEVLGRVPLGAKQNAHLLRVGNKMLLVAISAGGVETLTEIVDPMEVDRLAGICQQDLPHSSTNAFKQIFQQFAQRGEMDIEDDPLPDETPLSREVRHA